MTLTLLIDLDDTLLGNNTNVFLPAYTKALSTHLAPYVEPKLLISSLFAATEQAVLHQSLDRTLAETFEMYFYPAIDCEKRILQDTLDDFYSRIFPSLKGVTEFLPEAVKLVDSAIQSGYQIGIATSPLFPRVAIEHRLSWAGLSPDKYPFALIPSLVTFHFAKPNPVYFAEFLAQMGWPEGPVVMVGDDQTTDIASANQVGLATFWITQEHPSQNPSDPRSSSGSLDDLLPWLSETPLEKLLPDFSSPVAQLAILQSTPAALASLSREISPSGWNERPSSDEWSLTEITCHLRDVDTEVNLPRLKKIIQGNNPFIPGIDTDIWAEERQYYLQDGRKALDEFIMARLELVSMLEGLKSQDWQRRAVHAIFGPTTIAELVSIITSHDCVHIQQVHRL